MVLLSTVLFLILLFRVAILRAQARVDQVHVSSVNLPAKINITIVACCLWPTQDVIQEALSSLSAIVVITQRIWTETILASVRLWKMLTWLTRSVRAIRF